MRSTWDATVTVELRRRTEEADEQTGRRERRGGRNVPGPTESVCLEDNVADGGSSGLVVPRDDLSRRRVPHGRGLGRRKVGRGGEFEQGEERRRGRQVRGVSHVGSGRCVRGDESVEEQATRRSRRKKKEERERGKAARTQSRRFTERGETA